MKLKVVTRFKRDDGSVAEGFVPERATPFAAGWDLRACEDATVYAGCKARLACGIKVELEPGHVGDVRSRSGLAHKHGIFVLNSPGTIDSDYRGEVMCILHNTSQLPFSIKRGDRIAQLVVLELPDVDVEEVHELANAPTRGERGLGSTGVK